MLATRGGRLLVFLVSWIAAASLVLLGDWVLGGDWPTWRYDAGRNAATDDPLPSELHLQWVRQLPMPRPAWPVSQHKLRFDDAYQPIVLGKRMFVGSTVDDSITVYDTASGEQLWRFITDGPVRFAPIGSQGRLYVTSDDGHLVCLDVQDGRLIWKFRGGPAPRPILGNHRLISSWPLRGGAVLVDGVVYFTAGIWPSMGIFIHAVDAATGKLLWTNNETGSKFVVHPHDAPSFGSIVPQGYLAANANSLIVPGGRSVPAIFDRQTGQMRYFQYDKQKGDCHVIAAGNQYFLAGGRYDLTTGDYLGKAGPQVISDAVSWQLADGYLVATSMHGTIEESKSVDRHGNPISRKKLRTEKLWSIRLPKEMASKLYLKAGESVFTAGHPAESQGSHHTIARFDVRPESRESEATQRPIWTSQVEGSPANMIAADDKLMVVTREASVYCFGAPQIETVSYPLQRQPPEPAKDEPSIKWRETARSILQLDGAEEGYAIALGIGSGRLIETLIQESSLHVIVIERDPGKVDRFRNRMIDAGWYGTRVAVHVGDPKTYPFPPYLANLIVSEQTVSEQIGAAADAGALKNLFHALRPYGGVACLPVSEDWQESFARAVSEAQLAKARVSRSGGLALLRREGALPGAGSWTHHYGDAGNRSVSRDRLVKAPLGVLWFGGPPNDKILPRHGHGPAPQVVGGRLFIEGPDLLRAVDVYTGRVLWEKRLERVGALYDITSHFPGAGEYGSNYVSLHDSVYIIHGAKLLQLDAVDGGVVREFPLEDPSRTQKASWSYLTVWDDYLVAMSRPVAVSKKPAADQEGAASSDPNGSGPAGKARVPAALADAFDAVPHSSTSRTLTVYHRHTGERLWSRDADYSFRHNCLVAGAGKIFVLDGLSPKKMQALGELKFALPRSPRLLALSAATGRELWSTDQDIFGTFLSYSADHDVLLQGGSAFRDRARDEAPGGLAAFRGADGEVLWKDPDILYDGPCLLWKDKIITNGNRGYQLQLLTGERTGWTYSRMYGCNTIIGSENLLTFRSGAAGFCDLAGDSGTGNFGGFRSSCTSNLIVADGVLSAPDYTRTCTCAYQNQTSLAMVPMPEAELWTFNDGKPAGIADRIGINLGAPGDRRDAEGTLWLEYPRIGGPSPEIRISIHPEGPEYFSQHISRVEGVLRVEGGEVEGGRLKWVAASGARGIESVRWTLPDDGAEPGDPRQYSVRLHFLEPDQVLPGARVFSISLQGDRVLADFDIAQEAGGSNRAVVQTFEGILIESDLVVELAPSQESGLAPILCGIEVVADRR